ncbi:relaxase family protein, partial [Neisseria gonorrhoeae]
EHRDKGRLELNFVIPNIELLSGKRLQPYYYAADRGRVDAWRTMQNLTHGYSDPDDPAKRQSMTQAKDLPRNTQEAAQSITEHHRRLRSPSPIRQAKKPRRRAGNAGKGRF